MATLSKINHNKKRQKMVERTLKLRNELRATANSPHVSQEERDAARAKLHKLPRNTSATRVRNRCELTGRPRAYMRKFGLCRIKFRELALTGMIPGVTKSSW